MAFSEILYQNQMQFNLEVPLTASNIASHYHKPCPIMVERVGGRSAIPGKPLVQQSAQRNPNVSGSSSFNYTVLSEDRMAKISELAKRDLKNRRFQMQREREESVSAESIVPSQRYQPKTCARQRKPVINKPRTPLRAREADKNRRIGNVQTPPPRKPRLSNSQRVDDSLYSNTGGGEGSQLSENFFPVQPVAQPNNEEGPKDGIAKLQMELESYLQSLCRIEQQILREGTADFLQRQIKGKVKDNYLDEEQDLDRVRARAGEHNTRSARNLYNLCQKVKQLQRNVSHTDLGKPTKKSQIASQLNATYRGAVRALQLFVNQLPYQDLHMGLPSTYTELALLLRQLTTLVTLTQQGKSESPDKILSLLDKVDDFNSKWCTMALQSNNRGALPLNRKTNNAVQKDWVSDTKVESDFLSRNATEFTAKKQPVSKKSAVPSRPLFTQQTVKERMSRPGQRVGKENKFLSGPKPNTAKSSLTGQKAFGFVPVGAKQSQSSKFVTKDIDTNKGYLLPPDLVAKREKAQRAVELSNKNFAESTHSSRMKVTLGPRPGSAPSPGRRKEVNFDLREDRKSPTPWIPAGCAPCKPKQRSSSAERNPFYVRSLDDSDVWSDIPDRYFQSVPAQGRQRVPSYGYQSLPTDRQLSSCDVSDSFVDLIEKRILYRMMQGKFGTERGREIRKDEMIYRSDEALDITDLTVDRSANDSSLNVTAEAASMVDAPTLENIRLKLADMERTRREIRQRWSSLRFIDTQKRPRNHISDCPSDPPAIDYSTTKARRDNHIHHSLERPEMINKGWFEEPLLFTNTKTVHKSQNRHPAVSSNQQSNPSGKQKVTLNQATLDQILEDQEKFASHMRKHSYHPAGKFDPWTLMEQISEEILNECLQEVSEEVEKVSDEIANQMYKSEFMVTGKPADSPIQEQEDGHAVLVGTAMDDEVEEPEAGFGYAVNEYLMEHQDYSIGREFVLDEETPRSQGSGGGFELPSHGMPSEPLLDNVSQLVQEKVEGLVVEKSQDRENGEETDIKDEERDRDDEEDYEDEEDEEEDDDDDEDDYSEEFEDVSDVEL